MQDSHAQATVGRFLMISHTHCLHTDNRQRHRDQSAAAAAVPVTHWQNTETSTRSIEPVVQPGMAKVTAPIN